MNFQIFSARPNIEPLSIVHYQAADLAALPDPITDNRNEGNFPVRRESLENLSIPDGDIGKIVIASHTVPVRYVHNAVIAQSHGRGQTGFAQRERDVIPATKMFVDQRSQIDVRQDVPAIRDEWLAAEITFYILDAAAGFEQIRLMNQRDRMTGVAVFAKKVLE
jgi:hypothetical protein